MSGERETVTLATATDTWNFRVGTPVEMVWSNDGQFRVATRWERLRMRAVRRLMHWTRWFRPRIVCSAIDRDAGSLTLSEESWSWRRWRWE